ncbi:DUF938 domain-containing protein [Lyngbya confervoides]|uniref:Class I SAM-dependent methyltransferase n=1 Tax=Lyngbya confervoides BDU141951 TaxID=1574623 RepID=A0ABD4SZM9_9CYAN|nr:DUF938 domain-containing protein [Lyngbya confervoides]MCM1981849.1 class I SAM-dependent methyltransferase [Lyngbya confervoides BDU141951]
MPQPHRQSSPAVARNRDPIYQVLKSYLPPEGLILEIASGTGEHGAYFAPKIDPLVWQPSDRSPEALQSIRAWKQDQNYTNLGDPIEIDVLAPHWWQRVQNKRSDLFPHLPLMGIVTINMIHISPWEATLGLMQGAAALLPPQGWLYLYGPFHRNGVPTAPSNVEFDQYLQLQDPRWGVRTLEEVVEAAAGLALQAAIAMPANNLSVIFRKVSEP